MMRWTSNVGRRTPAAWWRMARMTVGLACLLVAALVPAQASAQGLQLAKIGGGTVSEAELMKGTTIAVVWATWSPRGKDIVQRINKINAKWGGSARVVAINFQEDATTIQKFLGDQKMNVPILLDKNGRFSKKHAVTWLPGLLVLQDGETAFRGRLGDNPDVVLTQALS